MNSELESFLATAPAVSRSISESTAQKEARLSFVTRFLETATQVIRPVMDSTAETLQKHGYGAAVELVRDQPGSDPNTFPYLVLHFSPERCSPADLGYLYTLTGASVSFICRRDELCAEAVVAHPASRSVERRVNFCTLSLPDLTSERVLRIVTDAVKQIVRR